MADTLGTDQPQEGEEHPNIRLMRQKAEKFDEAESALAQARRELAIVKSGIDAETPLGKFFVESYKGDFADVESIKEAAKEVGVPFIGTQVVKVEEPAQGSAEATEPTGTDERTALHQGDPNAGLEQKDPRQDARERYEQAMKKGQSWEKAAGEFVHTLAEKAQQGDPRVIVPQVR